MIASKFDPLKHGLPYTNGTFNVGTVGWTVLCGGLSYTALDYFESGIAPPTSRKTPADGNPMVEFLYSRQVTAHYYTWHRFLGAWAGAVTQPTLADLCSYLSSRPVILCLYGGFGVGHHVVASACDAGKKAIYLYDSNHPGRTSVLTEVTGGWLHSESGMEWQGWFMDWGHYTDGARQPPLAFRYCRTCHMLNTESLGVKGGCVSGGHDNHPDFEYFLPWKSGEGTGGWRVCGRCQGVYRQTVAAAPVCQAGGVHFPQLKNPTWTELEVMTEGPGESGWRRCGTCTSLFWVRNNTDTGTCFTRVPHVVLPLENYVVDYRTV
jgi:hypothetical protein